MTQTGYPLVKSSIATPQQWSKIAQHWLNTGVIKGQLNELQVYADSTGMQVKVKSGQAFLKGHFFESDVEEVLAIGSANATNPRIDRIIVRMDWTADTIQLAVLQGAPAVSPSAPALTQNTSRWEISVAQILVGANATTIASGNVTDERVLVGRITFDAASSTIPVAGGSFADFIVNFPPGLFPSAPNVTYSLLNSDVDGLYTTASGIVANTKDSATIRVKNKASSGNQYYIIYVKVSNK